MPDKSISISSPIVPTELSPLDAGLDSTSGSGDFLVGARRFSIQAWILSMSPPPSTTTKPWSCACPSNVPLYLESSAVLLCLFFRAIMMPKLAHIVNISTQAGRAEHKNTPVR